MTASMGSPARPGIKLVGAHVRSLGPLAALDLPRDGVAWEGEVPDAMAIGGPNGSGKTTLLEFLAFGVIRYGLEEQAGVQGMVRSRDTEAWFDLEITLSGMEPQRIRLLWGSTTFVTTHRRAPWCALFRDAASATRYHWGRCAEDEAPALTSLLGRIAEKRDTPSVILIPTGDWPITTGDAAERTIGPLPPNDDFVHRWQSPRHWRDSTDGLLHALRWADLNALAAGEPTHLFDSFNEAFDQFFRGRKALRWSPRGELYVEAGSVRHPITALSPGEQRVLILLSELRYRWRPGSLVLIDEPELHLHTRWQIKLWDVLCELREERGGQLIIATQSGDLLDVIDPRQVLLLGEGLR